MENQSIEIIIEQFKALREEIIWINSTKFLIIQAKYIWIAGITTAIITGYSYFRKKEFDIGPRVLLSLLTLFLFSLVCYDFLLEWLNCHVNNIGQYIAANIEPFLKNKANDFTGLFWEEYFKTTYKYHFFIAFGVAITSLLPLLISWMFLIFIYNRYKDPNIKVFSIKDLKRVYGIINLLMFIAASGINVFLIYKQLKAE